MFLLYFYFETHFSANSERYFQNQVYSKKQKNSLGSPFFFKWKYFLWSNFYLP
jgi:hypothetical protein